MSLPASQDFCIDYLQYINEESILTQPLPPYISNEFIIESYKNMVFARMFDSKAVNLQRNGKIGTYPSALGQEAFSIAIGMALEKHDVFVPYYRDHGAHLFRGHKIQDILKYWGGSEEGSKTGIKNDFPVCVPIATQITHAAGVATALKIKGDPHCVITTIGDGGTSKGDFFEGLNVAGLWQLPLIVIINNNQYAISVPRDQQCGAKTLAQKAIGAGMHGVQVDGNDPIAIYKAINDAKELIKHHKSGTVIEAVTYRLSDHTTADDASRYRSSDEVKRAWDIEPIKRLQTYLSNQNLWSEDLEKELIENCSKNIDKEVEAYLNKKEGDPEDMLNYLYENKPKNLDEDYLELKQRISTRGGNSHE